MKDCTVSLFKTVTEYEDIKNPHHVSILNVFSAIRKEQYKELQDNVRRQQTKDAKNDAKKHMPAAIFSGVFSYRNIAGFEASSNIINLDFDGMDRSAKEVMLKKVRGDKYTLATFTSPSGNGIKVLVKSNFSSPEEYKKRFYALDKYYGFSPYFDMACSDISRACFIPADKGIYVNELADVFEEQEDDVDNYRAKRKLKTPEGIFDALIKWTEGKGLSYQKGERNHYLFILGSAMCRYGVGKEKCEQLFLSKYSDLPDHEIRQVVKSAYRSNDFGVVDISETSISNDASFFANINVETSSFNPEDVIAIDSEDDDMVFRIAHGEINSESTGCEGLDKYAPLKKNEMYAFVAASKTGKSLAVAYLALMAAKYADWNFVILSTETSIAEYKVNMVSFLLDVPIKMASDEEIQDALDFINAKFLFIKNELDHLQIIDFYNYLRAESQPVDCIIIDPISNVSWSKAIKARSGNDYHNELYTRYLKFSKKHCALWLVAHVVTEKEREGKVPTVQDAEFGVYLARRVDYGFTFFRDMYNEARRSIMELHVRLVRSSITKGGDTTMRDAPIQFHFVCNRREFRYNIEVDGVLYESPLLFSNNRKRNVSIGTFDNYLKD